MQFVIIKCYSRLCLCFICSLLYFPHTYKKFWFSSCAPLTQWAEKEAKFCGPVHCIFYDPLAFNPLFSPVCRAEQI